MSSLLSRLANLLLSLFGVASPAGAISVAEAIVQEAMEAWLRNIKEVGVADGARFIAAARELSAEINSHNATGHAKRSLYLDAGRKLVVELGGDLAHTLTESVIRTGAELFHQPDAGVPPTSARTLGSTEGQS